jgi:hypothetical protein
MPSSLYPSVSRLSWFNKLTSSLNVDQILAARYVREVHFDRQSGRGIFPIATRIQARFGAMISASLFWTYLHEHSPGTYQGADQLFDGPVLGSSQMRDAVISSSIPRTDKSTGVRR